MMRHPFDRSIAAGGPPPGVAARGGRSAVVLRVAEAVRTLDERVDRACNRSRSSRVARALMVQLSNLGVYSAVWFSIGVAGILTFGARTYEWYVFTAAVPIEFVLTNGIVKRQFRRGRPLSAFVDLEVPGLRRPRTSSFPSGHSSAGAMAAVALLGNGWVSMVAAAVALLIASSRVFLRLHYASDVLGGLVWGGLLGWVVRLLA